MGKQTNAMLTAKINNQIAKVLYSPVHIRAEDKGVAATKTILSGEYLGASEVNIILNQKYRSSYNLAQEKVGIIPKKEVDNQFTRYGQEIEPYIINHIEKQGYHFLVEKKRCHDYKLSGIVDGIDYKKQIILEVKTFTNQPDLESYINQIHVYFHIWKYERAMLAMYQRNDEFDARQIEIYNILIDKSRIEFILNEVRSFWRKCDELRKNKDMKKKEFDLLWNGAITCY